MWINNIDFRHGFYERELIDFFIQNNITLSNSLFEGFFVSDNRIIIDLTTPVNISYIPKILANEWDLNVSALRLSLACFGVHKINTLCNKTKYICSPVIEKNSNKNSLRFHNKKNSFYCISDHIGINSVTPLNGFNTKDNSFELIKRGDLFCFKKDNVRYCFGRVLLVTSLGHLVEIFDYVSTKPSIPANKLDTIKTRIDSVLIDGAFLFYQGGWKIIGNWDRFQNNPSLPYVNHSLKKALFKNKLTSTPHMEDDVIELLKANNESIKGEK